MIKILGALLDKLNGVRMKYRTYRNTRIVKNLGGTIGGKCKLGYPNNIEIGKNSYVNGGELIASPNAKIKIGQNCLIAYRVHMRTDMHTYLDADELIREQGHSENDIVIGNDCWVGYGAQVMSGVIIADGCVIAAGAVVTKDTEPYGVYAGVPATLIKKRISNTKELSHERTNS